MSRKRGALAAFTFAFLAMPAFSAPPGRTVEVFPERVMAEYAACRERTDLQEMELLLQEHLIKRIDATIYGLPKDDFDDQIPLTIEERLMVRRDREQAGNPLPTSGPIQYPHHMRRTLDQWYVTTGRRPDCSKILERAKDQMELVELGEDGTASSPLALIQPLAQGSSWGSDKDLNSGATVDRGEVNIAVDFANQSRVMASAVPAGGSETSSHIARSADWGATFTSGQVGNNSGTTWECDPVSYYKSANGHVFHSKIGCTTGTCGSTLVLMRRSSDNGATWTDCARPTTATNSDRQWHVVDNTSTSPGYGNLYMTWHDGNSEKVVTTTNAQNCTTWNPVVTLTPSGTITPDINVGRNGHVYAVFGRYGQSQFQFSRSTDQGATWSAPVSVKGYNGSWSNKVIPQCGSRGVSTQPHVDANRCDPAVGNCSQTYPGRIYVTMMDFNAACTTQASWTCATWDSNWTNTCHYTIWLSYSDDGGATWSTPKDLFGATGINDGSNVDHILGYMRVDEKSGDIHIAYSGTTLNPASAADRQKTQQYVIRSTDGGANFTRYQASSMFGDERTGAPSSFERGDYSSIAVYNGVTWPVWIDRRSNTTVEHVITRKVCSEPTHWSERGTAPAAPPTTVSAAGAGVVTVSWTAPDLFWGDGDESPSSRKFQLYVDGSLVQDNIAYTTTSVSYSPGNCDPHDYFIRVTNQCGITKTYATTNFSATGCCANNPTSVSTTPAGPVTLCVGDYQTFTAAPTGGTGPFSYQWKKDGSNIAGATSSTLTVSDTGTHTYSCVITGNGCAGGTSGPTRSVTWLTSPTFAGLQSVTANPNATCQLTLAWNAATSCPGTVTYSVYRGASGFTPSLSNRIATGLTGTSYMDSNGLAGAVNYYVVRAAGPDGIEDTNTVRVGETPLGSLTPTTLFSDTFETGSGLNGWTRGAFSGDANDWRGIQTCTAYSGTKIFRYGAGQCTNNYASNNHALAYPGSGGISIPATAQNVRLSFYHRWDFEVTGGTAYDGAYMRLSLDGTTFTTIPSTATGVWISGGYTGTLASGYGAWTGTNTSFNNTVMDLDAACNYAFGGTAGAAGRTLYIGFTVYTDSSATMDGWFLDDVTVTADVAGSCNAAPSDVSFLTATYKNGSVKVEWVNPASSWTHTRIVRKLGSAPSGPTDGTFAAPMGDITTGGAGGRGTITDTTVSNGSTYYYGAYVWNGTSYSGGVSIRALPKAASNPAWGFGTRAAALTSPGVYPGAYGSGSLYVVSNDRSVYAVNVSATGGDWMTGYTPIAMNAPSQAPPVPFPVFNGNLGVGVTRGLFVGAQDGTDSCINAASGTSMKWTWASPGAASGDLIQAGTMFSFTGNIYGAQYDFVFAVTRNGGADNKVYALAPTSGVAQFSFDNGGGANGIGMITGTPWVDTSVTPNRIYFTSRKKLGAGSSGTLWCLDINANSFSLRAGFPVDIGDSDSGINIQHGRIYVGNNAGQVKCVNKDTGSVHWTYTPSVADGPVKSYVAVTRAGAAPWRCFFSTNTRVWAMDDSGSTTVAPAWNVTLPGGASPSYPLYTQGTDVWVSGSNGTLYELASSNGADSGSIVVESGAVLGSPSYWTFGGVKQVYVGTNTGAVYAVTVPLP